MSSHTGPSGQTSLPYWPFIHCSVCFLPFFSGSPSDHPPVPFWLTDCGHVVCNSHLSAIFYHASNRTCLGSQYDVSLSTDPDQSCASCHAPNIRPVPLQLPSETTSMTDWHLLLPRVLSQLTRTAQYQHESASALITHLQDRCRVQGAVLEKVKGELENLKVLRKEFEILQQENAHFRAQLGYPPANGPPSYQPQQNGQHFQPMQHQGMDPQLNMNGKRPHPEPHHLAPRPRTAGPPTSTGRGSSPRSAPMPMPMQPDRLTLPGQEQGAGAGVRALDRQTDTPRLEKFAYAPPATPRNMAPPLHMQHTHHRNREERPPQQRLPPPFPPQQQQRHDPNRMQSAMPPPPVPASRRTGGPVREMTLGGPSASRTAFRPLQPTASRTNPTPLPFQPQPRYPQQTHSSRHAHQNQNQQPFYPSTNLLNLNSGFGTAPPTPQTDRFGTAQRVKRFVPAGGGNGGTASRAGWVRASDIG